MDVLNYLPADIALWMALSLIAISFLTSAPVRWLEILLALFILWSIVAPRFATMAVAAPAYLAVGAATSFATMFLGATGPLLAIFIAPDRYGRDKTVATHAACMSFQHFIKVIAFGFLGFVLSEWLPLVLAMIASGLAGTRLGRGLLYRFPEDTFRRAFKIVLTLLALRLMYKAIAG